MEIKYTLEKADIKIFGKNKVCGLYDEDGTFIKTQFSNLVNFKLPKMKIGLLFKIKVSPKNYKILKDMLDELELSYIVKKNLKELSTSEFIKVQTLVAFLSKAKVIILRDIDNYLNNRDFKNLIKILKNNNANLSKTVILESNKLDNLISNSERYIIIEEEKPIYIGEKFKEIPIDFSIKKFVTLANKKGAKLDLYKDESDLLKAIYRSVKK